MKGQDDQRRMAAPAQLAAVLVVLAGWFLGLVAWPGLAVIAGLAAWHLVAMRRQVSSARRVGVLQMFARLVVVAVTAPGCWPVPERRRRGT